MTGMETQTPEAAIGPSYAERTGQTLQAIGDTLLRNSKKIGVTTLGIMAVGLGGPGHDNNPEAESAGSSPALSAPDFFRPGPGSAEAADNYTHVTLKDLLDVLTPQTAYECDQHRKKDHKNQEHAYIAGDGKCGRIFFGLCHEQKPTPRRGYCENMSFRITFPLVPDVGYHQQEYNCSSPHREVVKFRVRKPTRSSHDVPAYVERVMLDPIKSVPFVCTWGKVT